MSRLKLPPIERRTSGTKQSVSSAWKASMPQGWHFTPKDITRFESMGLDANAVKQIAEAIGSPVRFNLSDYIYSARLAGVPPQAFVEIAKSGALASPPALTVLRQYLGACNHDPLLAMLAYRAKLSPQELADLQQDGELTIHNLRAMIDLSS